MSQFIKEWCMFLVPGGIYNEYFQDSRTHFSGLDTKKLPLIFIFCTKMKKRILSFLCTRLVLRSYIAYGTSCCRRPRRRECVSCRPRNWSSTCVSVKMPWTGSVTRWQNLPKKNKGLCEKYCDWSEQVFHVFQCLGVFLSVCPLSSHCLAESRKNSLCICSTAALTKMSCSHLKEMVIGVES